MDLGDPFGNANRSYQGDQGIHGEHYDQRRDRGHGHYEVVVVCVFFIAVAYKFYVIWQKNIQSYQDSNSDHLIVWPYKSTSAPLPHCWSLLDGPSQFSITYFDLSRKK